MILIKGSLGMRMDQIVDAIGKVQLMAFALTLGGVTFLMAVIWGSPLVELMRRLKLGKQIRIDGPQTHMTKMGTPAMGGILIVGWVVLISIVVNIVQIVQALEIAESVVIPLGVMVAYSILGGIDDYLGFRLRPGERDAGAGQNLVSTGHCFGSSAVAFILWSIDGHGWVAVPTVPFLLDIGILYIPIAVIIIAGTANAVNITDGLDGLAGIIAATAFAAYGIIAFLQDQQFLVDIFVSLSLALVLPFCGSMPNRRKCLWVMSARRRWAVRWVWSP